jgi:hypothetical protein
VTTRTVAAHHQHAHYQHERPVLDALVSPGVDHPRAMTWVPDEPALVLASRSGGVTLFEPAYGTRQLGHSLAEPTRIAVGFGLFALLDTAGRLDVRAWPGFEELFRASTDVVGLRGLVCWRGGVAVVGDDSSAVREVSVYDAAGALLHRTRVPPRTALGTDRAGDLVLARSTDEGISVTPLGDPLPSGAPTAHTLRVHAGRVLGVASGGVTAWGTGDTPPVTVKASDVSGAAFSPDGENVAIGFRSGGVAYASARPGSTLRHHPARVEGHDSAVFAVEFSSQGRWLATCSERCWVWSY